MVLVGKSVATEDVWFRYYGDSKLPNLWAALWSHTPKVSGLMLTPVLCVCGVCMSSSTSHGFASIVQDITWSDVSKLPILCEHVPYDPIQDIHSLMSSNTLDRLQAHQDIKWNNRLWAMGGVYGWNSFHKEFVCHLKLWPENTLWIFLFSKWNALILSYSN